jgi:uncharacterized protein YjcR
MKVPLEEIAKRLCVTPRTIHQWRWKYKNTDHPCSIFITDALCPTARIFYDESILDKYWELVGHKNK